ncbi:MAG: LysM peptidoglycan-binding domain-containing protein, partial [Acidimicrobiales bacterium]|nr:LysM peptidoglycan-binding domain-containing protein [Acidimicrobiales bacterium]
MRRRRRMLGALSGLLAVAAVAGAVSANTDAKWATASIGALVAIYLGLLARFRPGRARPGGPAKDRAADEWSSPYLLDRWAVTRFLWAGLAGCVFKLLVTLTERLARDGLPLDGIRGAVLERGLRLHGQLADRALRSLAASATAAAGVTVGNALVTSHAASAAPLTGAPAAASTAAIARGAPTLAVGGADPSPITYQVVAGDTLSGIAERFGTTVAALVSANSIADPDLILVGQTLTMVGPNGTLSPSQIAELVSDVGFQGASVWE